MKIAVLVAAVLSHGLVSAGGVHWECGGNGRAGLTAEQQLAANQVEKLQAEGMIGEEQVNSEVLHVLQQWMTLESRLDRAKELWIDAEAHDLAGDWGKALKAVNQVEILLASKSSRSSALVEIIGGIRCVKAQLLQKLGDNERAFDVLEDLSDKVRLALPWYTSRERFVLAQAGQVALKLGHATKAKSYFERAVALDPQDGELHKNLAQSLDLVISTRRKDGLEPELLERVVAHLKRAVRFGSSDIYTVTRLGSLLVEREEWETAGRVLRKAVQQWPDSMQLHLQLGRVLHSRASILRNYESETDTAEVEELTQGALTHLQQATWLNASSFDAHFSFGCLLHEEGRLEEALDVLSSASKLASSDDEALWLELGLVSAELKHTEPAIEFYQRALNASNSVDRQLELSESLGQYLESQGLFERAKVLYNNLLALQLEDEQHSNVLVKVGSVMFAQGSVSEAQKVYVEAHLLSASAETYAGLGDCLFEAGDVESALEHYEAAIELGGSNVHVLTMAGKLSTDRDRAQELLSRAIRLWPMSSHAHHAMGRFWLVADPNAACPELQQAIFLDQNCVECLLDLTEALVATGKFHRALDAATKAYKLEKENARVHLLMGTVLVRLEQAQGALESFEKAALLSQKPKDSTITAEALTNAAAVYTQRRKPTRAIANLYEAIEHVPSFQPAHESLALLLAATGQSELARKHREIADTLGANYRHRMTKEVEEDNGIHTPSTPRLTETGVGAGTAKDDGRENQEDLSLGTVTTWTHRVASSFHDLKGKLMGSVHKPSHESETADHQKSASSLSMDANSTEDHVNRTSTPKECLAKTTRSRHSGKLLIEEAGSLFQIAGLFAEQGQLEAAVSCFQHVSESNHVELGPAAKLELAILLQEAEPHRAQVLALEAAETFSVEHPKHVDAQLWAAHLLKPSPSLGKATSKSSADGDAGLRLALLLDASRVHSDASEVHHALGVEWLTRGDNQRALAAFQHAEFCLRSNSSVEAADTLFRVASLLETNNPEAASRLLFIVNMNPETRSDQIRLASTLPLDLQFPTFDELRTAAKVELGHRYVSLGQGQKASDVLVQVSQELASEPSPEKRAMASRALTDIGQVLLADKQRDIARIFLIAAYASCSNDQALLETLSESEVQNGPLFWREIALRQELALHHALLECSADTTRLLALYEEYGMLDQAITLAHQLGNRGTLMKMMAAKASFDESMRLLMTWKDQSDTSVLDLALEMTLSENIASRSRLLAHALDLATTREEGLEQRVEEEAFEKFPALSLAYGRYLERTGDSDKALSVFRRGLGSDFEHITANSIASVLEAYLLVLPHMYTVLEASLDRKPVLDSATVEIHKHVARLVSNPGEKLLHAWWAIFGCGGRETTSARLELHVIAARAAFELANMLPTSSLSQSALVKLARRDIHQVQSDAEDEERTTAVRCTAAQLSILSKVPEKAIEELSAITVPSCACKSAALAQAYFTLGNEEYALKAYEETLVAATSPTLECSAADGQAGHSGCGLKSVDALVQYAQLLEKRGNVDLAIKAFEVAHIDFEHLIPAHGKAGLTYAFGNMLFHSGAKMQAVQVLQEAAESMPNHIGTRNNLGATLIRVGQLEEAIKQLEFAFSLCEKATNSTSRDIDFCKVPARVNMAIALENMGDYEGATLQVKAVLAHSRRPGSTIERVAVKRQLARLMLAQNDPGSAVVTLRNTIKSLENELKKTTGAIGTLDERRARERARNLQDLIDTLRDLGLLYSNAEQHDAAVKALKRVLVLSSVGSVNLNENQGGDVGLTSSTVWDLVDIIPVKAVESTLKHPQALVDLGNAFFAAGNFVQAKSIYQWCTKLFPGHGSAYNNLGVIAFRNGEWEAATGNFTKALALDPENEQARSALTQVGEDGPAPWLLDVLPANELPPRSGTKLFVD